MLTARSSTCSWFGQLERQDRGVKPLVLQVDEQVLVVELDVDRGWSPP